MTSIINILMPVATHEHEPSTIREMKVIELDPTCMVKINKRSDGWKFRCRLPHRYPSNLYVLHRPPLLPGEDVLAGPRDDESESASTLIVMVAAQ
jgi:hypothetical protein